jgi:serine/threonine-protein kinase RsbW
MPVIARDIRYPGTPTCFEVVHEALTELWVDADDVDPTDRMLFETALIEIVGNLVEHARRPDGLPVDVHMQLTVHEDRVEARMRDNGIPAHVDSAGAQMPDEFAEGGRGLALAAAVTDLAHVHEDDGNTWTVIRHRTA